MEGSDPKSAVLQQILGLAGDAMKQKAMAKRQPQQSEMQPPNPVAAAAEPPVSDDPFENMSMEDQDALEAYRRQMESDMEFKPADEPTPMNGPN